MINCETYLLTYTLNFLGEGLDASCNRRKNMKALRFISIAKSLLDIRVDSMYLDGRENS